MSGKFIPELRFTIKDIIVIIYCVKLDSKIDQAIAYQGDVSYPDPFINNGNVYYPFLP